jgi:hypothetical protein
MVDAELCGAAKYVSQVQEEESQMTLCLKLQ